jgi:malonyl CoA-acyl carrier protein transacylase
MKPGGPLRLGEAAVVGIGIQGLGLEGADAFMDLLFRNRDDLPEPVQERDPILLAQAAAAEAMAGAGAWDPARSAVFLSLDRPGGDLDLLPRMLQREFGFLGLGGACLGDELGGNRAMQAAVRRIQAGVLDGALVGAVQTWPESALDGACPGAFAVFLALRRRDAAEKAGDRIWAVVGPGPERERKSIRFDPGNLLSGQGRTVSGLLQVAAGCVMAGHHAWYCQEESRWEPFLDRTDGAGFLLEVETPGGERTRTDLWRPFLPGPPPLALLAAPGIFPYAGATEEELLQRVLRDEPGGQGPVRLALVAHSERERRELLERVPRLVQCGREGWLEGGVCFSSAPVQGKIACLFTTGGTSYLGMGRDLLLGLPILPSLIRPLQDLAPADWVYGTHPGSCGDPLHECAGSMFLSQVHAGFTRDLLGLRPDLALGLSLGELNALIAYGAWGAPEGEPELLKRGGIYAKLFSGAAEAARRQWGLPEGAQVQWRTWSVFGPVSKVLERSAQERRAHVSIVFSPVHCLLAGDSDVCRRILAGCPGLTAFPAVGLAEHTPVMAGIRAAWYRLHRRPTHPVPGVAFYSNHFGGAYEPTEERVAEALTGQAMAPLDFPAAAWRAWDSGVRVFIEHGPRNLLTSALMRILPRQEGVFLSLDLQGENSFNRAVKVAAELWCRGVPVDLARLQAALGQAQDQPGPVDPMLDVAASLFAASLERTGTLDEACQACLRQTRGRFLELLGQPPEQD